VWITLWALVLSTLAPTLAAWAGAGTRDGGFHVELCTEAGMVRIAVGDVEATGHGEDPSQDGAMLGHCPLCATYACVLPPSTGRTALPRCDDERLVPSCDVTASGLVRLDWTPAHPRAPPPAV
jgi:hypothetical protein